MMEHFSAIRLASRGNTWLWVGLITAIGAALRLFGILHGFQEDFLYHPDTHITLNEVWPKVLGEDWLKGSYNGAFYNLLLSKSISLAESIIQFLGYSHWVWSMGQIAVVASLFAALFGTMTIPVVYCLGSKAYDRSTGVLAALFISLCPLHTFQSHYPYRDVPMVFFLSLTLLFCLKILNKPSLTALFLGGISALLTIGLKPAGLVVMVPLAAALALGFYHREKKWWHYIVIGLVISLGLVFFTWGGVSSRFSTIGELVAFLKGTQGNIIQGAIKSIKILNQWLGLPFLLTTAVGTAWGFWRMKKEDFLLLIFLATAFMASSFYAYTDERFLVFLLPVMTILSGRFIVAGWRVCSGRKILKTGLLFLALGLTTHAFIESVWESILFSLPDTRAVSGRWLEAHFPKTIKVAIEEYFPLGVNQWPKVTFFDPSKPLDQETIGQDLLVTSSLEHQRYLLAPERYLKETDFFQSLSRKRTLIKNFPLGSLGFLHSDIDIYSPYPVNPDSPRFFFPRPFDSSWNFGISFLDRGPFDRDDRTLQLGWHQRYTATLVSPKPGQEIIVFILNGSEKGQVKIRVGGTTKIRTMAPGEFHVLTFRPKWLLPKRPALYYYEAGLLEGNKVLIQLRWGNREIGQAFSQWGLHERALPYLKKAIAANDPYAPELYLLLGSVYKQLGKISEAKQTFRQLTKVYPQFIGVVNYLAHPDLTLQNWDDQFRKSTGLDPSLLTKALSREFNSQDVFPSRSGTFKEDPQVPGGRTVVYQAHLQKPDEVLHGPYLHLDPGAYRAGFFLRCWSLKGSAPLAIIKVLADDKIIDAFSVGSADLKDNKGNPKEVKIPFEAPSPRTEIKFQVFATGQADFAIDKIRIEPDLRKIIKKKWDVINNGGEKGFNSAEKKY
jgi:tetratricopeptide (TPR) repeat protein